MNIRSIQPEPAIDTTTSGKMETATFAMGCFWSPDALFGSLEGVVRTRVGYAGGTGKNPTYRTLGDHIETVQLDYAPSLISYQCLVDTFFEHHKPIREPWKRQYMSAVFYHNPAQKSLFEHSRDKLTDQLGKKIFTALYPFEEFFLAEDRHQKYKLQRQPLLLAELQEKYPSFQELVNSTAAARVNAYLYGYGKKESLAALIPSLHLSPEGEQLLLEFIKAPKGIHCQG